MVLFLLISPVPRQQIYSSKCLTKACIDVDVRSPKTKNCGKMALIQKMVGNIKKTGVF